MEKQFKINEFCVKLNPFYRTDFKPIEKFVYVPI